MRRILALTLAMLVAGVAAMFTPAQASISGGDPSGDVIDRVLQYRSAFKKDTTAQGSQLDITNWSFAATGGFFTASISTAAGWPAEGTPANQLPTSMVAAGLKTLEARWVFGSSRQEIAQTVGDVCTDKSSEYENPVTNEKFNPVTYNTAYCYPLRYGPYPQGDGWSLFLVLTGKLVNNKWHYTWGAGWFEEITQIFYSIDGEGEHDAVADSSQDGVLNGSKFCEANSGQYSCSTPSGGTTMTLKVPFQVRQDAADDKDGMPDEFRSHTFAGVGDLITRVTAATYATADATVPDPPLCPGQPGEPTEPIVKELPPPLNDPNECYSQSAGVTVWFDHAPGNPFGPTGADWGGFLPRVFPRAISRSPGTGSPFCNYPAGLLLGITGTSSLFGGNYVPSSVNTKGAVTLINGATVDVPPNGGSVISIPSVPVSGTEVPLPIGKEQACGHGYLDIGLHWTDATGDFNVS